MTEQTDLTKPIPSRGGTRYWRVDNLRLYWGSAEIVVGLVGENGERLTIGYDGTKATALMVALNKADLTAKSLHRRVLEQLATDGKLDGTVTGVPD